MNAYTAYKQASAMAMTRIDLLLALYDGAIERIAVAINCLREGKTNEATPYLARAQLIVAAIASGVRPQVHQEIGVSTLRLCEYVAYQISQSTPDGLASALTVLNSLRQGFEKIRPEAAQLERTGQIPPGDKINGVQAVA